MLTGFGRHGKFCNKENKTGYSPYINFNFTQKKNGNYKQHTRTAKLKEM
jgi:hypothetical protein